MKISIEEIEICFKRIIKTLKATKIDPIELDTDYYLIIPSHSWDKIQEYFESKKKDQYVAIGSLYDDIESLQKMMHDTDWDFCTYVEFDRVASVLRAISQKINPP